MRKRFLAALLVLLLGFTNLFPVYAQAELVPGIPANNDSTFISPTDSANSSPTEEKNAAEAGDSLSGQVGEDQNGAPKSPEDTVPESAVDSSSAPSSSVPESVPAEQPPAEEDGSVTEALPGETAGSSVPAEETAPDLTLQNAAPKAPPQNGWSEDGKSYFVEGQMLQSCEYLIDNVWYYFQADGTYATGAIRIADGRMMYYDAQGHLDYTHTGLERATDGKQYWLLGLGNCVTGEKMIDGAWRYFDPAAGGAMVQDAEVTLADGRLMRYDAEGRLVLGWYQTSYYLSTGKVRGTEILIDNAWYYFQANGTYATGAIRIPDGRMMYYDAHGKLDYTHTGIERAADGKQYWLLGAGNCLKGEKLIGGAWYYFDPAANGAMVQNSEVILTDGRLMRYDAEGRLVLGWHGKSYYLSTGKVRGTELKIENKWYYFDANGNYVTGLITFPDGSQKYYDANGVQVPIPTDEERLEVVNGKTYFKNWDGSYYIGEKMIAGAFRYFDPATGGAMVQDAEVTLADGRLMRYDAQGRLVLGWYGKSYYLSTGKVRGTEILIDNAWYYFQADGTYATGAIRIPDGRMMYYDAKGKLDYAHTGLERAADGKQYWLLGTGKCYKGEKLIDGSWHYFDPAANGAMVQGTEVVLTDGRLMRYDAEGRLVLGWYEKSYYLPTGKVRNTELAIEGKTYYFDASGNYVTGAVKLPDGKVNYYGAAGVLEPLYEGLQKANDGYYYYLMGRGAYVAHTEKLVEGSWRWFDEKGHMAINAAVKLPDGRVYFYNQDGCMVMDFVGLAIAQDGNAYYILGYGNFVYNQGKVINGKEYWFGADGKMIREKAVKHTTGQVFYYDANGVKNPDFRGVCQEIMGPWYALTGQGTYVTNSELNWNGWRWFDANGHMAISQAVSLPDGRYLYYGADGVLTTGFVVMAGKTYYFTTSGPLYNWQLINGQYYYFKADGSMAVDWVFIDGSWKYFNANGVYTGQERLHEEGIDLSAHNGAVDFVALKNQGLSFVMLKAVGSNSAGLYIDPTFEQSVYSAAAAGFKIGAYIYSYAFNNQEMIQEIQFLLNSPAMQRIQARGIKFDYPIVIDQEDPLVLANTTRAQRTEILVAGCEYLKSQGWYPAIYMSKSWAYQQVDPLALMQYDVWIAQWGSACTYTYPNLTMWQYTNEGRKNGVNGRVDLNYSYKDYATLIRNNHWNKY